MWESTLSRKLDSFDCLDDFDVIVDDKRISTLAQVTSNLGPRVAAAAIKSWANAWTTSSRMHDPIPLPCIFGCEGGEDSLNHYLCCDPLWTAVISCSFRRTELLWSDPVSRLGLDGSQESLKMLTVAFSCYHALRMGHRDEVFASLACGGHSCQVHDSLVSYAKVYASEICV